MSREDVSPTTFGRLYHGQTAIDFFGKRRYTLAAAGAVLVITVIALLANGLNLGLDFEGGTAWDVPASDTFGVDEAGAVLSDHGIDTDSARIQRRTSESNDVITIQAKELSADDTAAVTGALAEAAGVPAADVSASFTSSTWGSEITEKALRALVIFLVIVSIFITFRFEWRMAAAAFVAMIHDVVAIVGVYAVFRFEVSPATVIAFLTILGYSLYDTIVVFDRVKENESKFAGVKNMPYGVIVNISMNQVLMRSLNTSITSVLPVASMLVVGVWIMGAKTLRDFTLALFIGMLIGMYSSIFIASPVLGMIKSRGERTTRPLLEGDELRARVMGTGLAVRQQTADDVLVDAAGAAQGGTSGAAARSTMVQQPTDKLLSHPPRPRRKKRR